MVEEKKLVKILTVRPELCPDEFILIFSSSTCVSQLTTRKRQEAETAGGVSTCAHTWVWTAPHGREPPGIFGEMAVSRSGTGKAFALLF